MEIFETYLPFWKNLKEEEKKLIKNVAVERTFSKGEILASSQEVCIGMVMVLSGDIRVSLISEDGRLISLYHVGAGETCVMTAACVIEQLAFETMVTAEVETRVLVIPPYVISRLSKENIYLRSYLYERLTQRFSDVVWVMEQILFKRIDQRVAQFLLDYYEKTGQKEVRMTQEEIGNEINSAREVVARMMKQFSRDGLVEVKRGKILLKDVEGLIQYCE